MPLLKGWVQVSTLGSTRGVRSEVLGGEGASDALSTGTPKLPAQSSPLSKHPMSTEQGGCFLGAVS